MLLSRVAGMLVLRPVVVSFAEPQAVRSAVSSPPTEIVVATFVWLQHPTVFDGVRLNQWFKQTLMVFRRTPLARRVKLGELWPTWKWEKTWRLGYCSSVTAGKKASCDTDTSGTWKVWDGLNATGMHTCATRCQACDRCRFVSYSARFGNCDWFTACNLDALSNTVPGEKASGRNVLDYVTLQVQK